MPMYQLQAHCQMLPRLEAEERLRLVVAASYGMGGGPEAQRYVRQLQGVASPQESKLRPPSAADFGGLGVRVKMVPKKG